MTSPDITIPPEALEAARVAAKYNDDPILAACLAMLKAWPGMRLGYAGFRMDKSEQSIILPLQEPKP